MEPRPVQAVSEDGLSAAWQKLCSLLGGQCELVGERPCYVRIAMLKPIREAVRERAHQGVKIRDGHLLDSFAGNVWGFSRRSADR